MMMARETDAKDGSAAPVGGDLRISRLFGRRMRRATRNVLRRPLTRRLTGAAIFRLLSAVHLTQRSEEGSSDFVARLTREHPAIVALWHGQHLLAPFFRPKSLPYVALLSRNADADINSAVVERFGIRTVRGSGGRLPQATYQKGGARALIALRRMLREGFGVCMIADVPKGKPREAGLGIVTLARISGRPIIPSAAVTSRAYVIHSSWDKTRVPLPFGRLAVVMGDSITVPADADAELMELKRRQLTEALEAANDQALAIVTRRR